MRQLPRKRCSSVALCLRLGCQGIAPCIKTPLNVEPHLTFREHQILELVAVGSSAKQIAIEINIAPRTVERHIENVRLELNARNRAHLITQAMHLGLLVIRNTVARRTDALRTQMMVQPA